MLSLFGLFSNKNLESTKRPERSIASDCNTLISKIINTETNSNTEENILVIKSKEKLFKIKNSIWNKIMGPHDFQNFNDQEYFRWTEIYKDANAELSNLNPVSIEQKMALIEVINTRLLHKSLNSEKSFTEEAQRLNLYKLRKLQKHMRSFKMNSKLTHIEINRFAADLMFILKGPPITLMDYFTANKTARMNARLMKMVQEDMLLLGLKGVVARIPEKDSYTKIEKMRYIIKKFVNHKFYKYLVLPYDLPWSEKVRIPDELLEKILVDGLEAHDQELINHLKKQNMIDHYERFRKVYRPIAFSIGFYFYFEKFNDLINQKKDDELFLDFFKKISEAVNGPKIPIETNENQNANQLESGLNKKP